MPHRRRENLTTRPEGRGSQHSRSGGGGMSLNETDRRRRPARGLIARTGVVVVLGAGGVVAALLMGRGSTESTAPAPAASAEGGAISPALRAKLAAGARFAPGSTQYEAGEAGESAEGLGDGAQEWLMHSAPGASIPLAAINQSREDWKGVKSRGNSAAKLGDHGKWKNLGPDNAVYPLNPFRNRYVYVPNQYVAAGRTAFSLIDPNCGLSSCRYWIANAGGGVWRTDNILAPHPSWEYLSPEFHKKKTGGPD